jgi:arginyl-tRNA synthetase
MVAKAIERLERGLEDGLGVPVALERPNNPEHGDYATNAAMRAAPLKRKPPMEIAEELRVVATALPGVKDAAVAPPGFVNIQLDPAWYGEALGEILSAGRGYGGGSAAEPERVQVEFVSANPTGPLTVASARNAAYGDSVARLLEFAGNTVEREFYVNDAGAQIDLFRASVEARRKGDDPPPDGYQGDYVAELAEQDGDPVEPMLAQIRKTLERFRVLMDLWVRQSEMEIVLDEALAEIELYEDEGARWLATTKWGDDKERLIYVLGADHHGYIARLKAIAGALGHDPEAVEVLIYQLVQLTEGGQARKVSKRRGDVVFLDELLDEIGVDAARWHLLSRGHEQVMDIDVDLARERTEKNPVYYVQYAHARIAGILRNAEGRAASPDPSGALSPEERELVKRLAEFPAVVAEATERRGPHALPTYAIRVADDFHRFYHHHRVLESEEEPFRLALSQATASVIDRTLDLMGVEAPERM